METLCGDAGSRGRLACVFEGDGRMLSYGIKKRCSWYRFIDISDFVL